MSQKGLMEARCSLEDKEIRHLIYRGICFYPKKALKSCSVPNRAGELSTATDPVVIAADYLAWVASVAPILLAPEEVNRIASYDNARGENLHRLVEFEFDSYVDMAIYLSRLEVAAVFEAVPDHSSDVSIHTFVQRSDHSKDENPTRRVKLVYLIDYPLGGKDAYLEWVASVSLTLASPEQVKRIAAYDNIHGVSPHRFVEFEFDSIEQANKSNLDTFSNHPIHQL